MMITWMMNPRTGDSLKSNRELVMYAVKMAMATLIKLFATRIVASKRLGIPSSLMTV